MVSHRKFKDSDTFLNHLDEVSLQVDQSTKRL